MSYNDKVLVLGGSGMVGKTLKDYMDKLTTKHNWIFTENRFSPDLTNYDATFEYIHSIKPTVVVNLAGRVGGLFSNMTYPVEYFIDNMLININVMKACANIKSVKHLVSCLSTCIFPDNCDLPLTPDVLHSGAPHPSNECYSYAKRMVDVLTRAYRREYGCNFTTIVPSNLYGEFDHYEDPTNSHVVPALITKMLSNTFVELKGTGKPQRQFTYARDLARAIYVITSSGYSSETPLIIANPEEVSISTLAALIKETLIDSGLIDEPERLSVRFTGNIDDDGQYKKTASTTEFTKLFPLFQFTPLKEGLISTINNIHINV